jgi:drug/metabolite transporter (DMT)-like permease
MKMKVNEVKYGSIDNIERAECVQVEGDMDNAEPASKVFAVFLACLTVGPLNFVSYKIMYAAFGESRAFFVSQGVNFLYVLYGGVILHILSSRGEITDTMKSIPHIKFMTMGFLDSVGGFLAAMGANQTSGSMQQLLNQTLIPITMLLSWLVLGKKSSGMQLIGAVLIFLGAWVVLIPSTDSSSSQSSYALISNMLYFLSNVPIAMSIIYKEMGFRNVQVHVMYMTQWVSIYQLLWGFVLGIFQLIPGVGSSEGSSLSEINSSFWSGVTCYLQLDEECSSKYTFFLLSGYCVINFIFNVLGLYLVKHDGAVLSTITNALLLPLTVLTFNLSWLGPYQEEYNPLTIVGLGIVMVGFVTWRTKLHSQETEVDDEAGLRLSPAVSCASLYTPISRNNSFDSSAPDAFYDRVIVLSMDN